MGVYSTCQVNIILIHVDDMKQRNSKNVSPPTKESIAVLNNSQQEMFINMRLVYTT